MRCCISSPKRYPFDKPLHLCNVSFTRLRVVITRRVLRPGVVSKLFVASYERIEAFPLSFVSVRLNQSSRTYISKGGNRSAPGRLSSSISSSCAVCSRVVAPRYRLPMDLFGKASFQWSKHPVTCKCGCQRTWVALHLNPPACCSRTPRRVELLPQRPISIPR